MLGAAMALGACATVTKGTDDTVKFESTPPGANVSFKEVSGRINQAGCVTPCTLEINRKFTYSVEVAKEGYQTYVQLLEPKLSGDGTAGMAGNILLGGVIGAAVDASTGAMNDLKPNPLIANLVPLTEAGSEVVVQSSASPDIGVEITAAADEVAAVVEDTAQAVGQAVTGSN
ncbi:MAG: PEGA domain-containing protein [Hyphomonas sp.]